MDLLSFCFGALVGTVCSFALMLYLSWSEQRDSRDEFLRDGYEPNYKVNRCGVKVEK